MPCIDWSSVGLRRRFGRLGKRSTGLIGAIDEILAGRLISGMLIAIFRLTAGAAADLDPFAEPLMFAVGLAARVFLSLTDFPETFLLLTLLLAPLVTVLVAVFLAGFPLAAVLATFFPGAVFCGAFVLLSFGVATFFLDDAMDFFADFVGRAFLPTLLVAAVFLDPGFLPAALFEAFFWLLPAAFLLDAFFRSAMLSVPAFAQSLGSAKWRIIHSHPAVGSGKLSVNG